LILEDMMYRVVLCIAFALGLSACSATRPNVAERTSLEELSQEKYHNSNASTQVPGSPTAVAVLPVEAGHVTRVSQTHYVEGFQQEITYDQPVPGLSANGIDLRVRTSNLVALDQPLTISKPTEQGIHSELASQFPRMTMQVVDRARSNGYGSYGLAVGRWANGVRCIYAWQWIDSVKVGASSEGGNPASVRIRLCRKDATLDQLAGYVDRLQIDPGSYNRLDVTAVKIEKPAPIISSSVRRVSVRQTARKPHSERAIAIGELHQVPRPSTVATAVLPQSPESQHESPLDPTLPAAAYRGPGIVTPIASASIGK
jgi:Cellulose biosynthesis protein BcsN